MSKKIKNFSFIFFGVFIILSGLVLSGCSKQDASSDEESCIVEGESGEVYPGSSSCCEGLSGLTCDEPDENGNCRTGCSETFVCANCGNGECGDGENKCNCPVDCAE
jgi:hypothetical protein